MNPSIARGTPVDVNAIESRFRGAIAASLDAFFLVERAPATGPSLGTEPQPAAWDVRVVELNERAERFLGRARDEVVGEPLSAVFPLARASGLLDSVARVLGTGASFEDEVRFDLPDRDPRWVHFQAVRVGESIAITVRDVTKRRQLDESLRASEARFRHLVESASDGIYRINPQGIFTYANPVVSRMLGFAADDPGIVGRLYLDFVRADYREQGMQLYRRQITERIPVTYWEFPALTLGGAELWIGQNVQIEQQDGKVIALFAVARDITERKTAELALRESEQLHRFLAEQSTDMLSRASSDGTFRYVSGVCTKLLGYTAEEMVGQSAFGYVHPDDLESVRSVFGRVLANRGSETISFRVRRRDGRFVWFETTHQAVADPQSGAVDEVLSVSRDITERRRLDEEMRHAQRMEAVGHLAGGVAHDFNNLLTAIRGFTEVLAGSFDADDPRRQDVSQILGATERAGALTSQLLAFSRRQVLRLEIVSVNAVIEDMTKIIRRLLGDSTHIVSTLEPNLWTSRADPGQLEQVLLKLSLNARDAMPGGGTLRLTTRNVTLDATADSVLPAGRYVVLEIADTGPGLSDEAQAHIFDPFFTRKGSGARADLGLAAVYGIVTQSGGHISVRSARGQGTTFIVHLPAEDGAADTSQPAHPRLHSPTGNVVLIAEDNEAVRVVTTRVLESAGYHVLAASDGLRAVEVMRDRPTPVDLLLTDVTMPRMSGTELATHFAQFQPGTPVLFMTGFTDEETVRRACEDGAVTGLQKPFSAEALLEAVGRLIGSGS